MAIVERTTTYPDGRIVKETIDTDVKTVDKSKVTKADEPKDKPEKKRKSVRQTLTTNSSS
jgi:hypothetical protein